MFKRNKAMYLINRLGSLSLGDRFDTNEWKVEGNKIFIGKDTGWFSVSGGSGGGWLSNEARDVVVGVDFKEEK